MELYTTAITHIARIPSLYERAAVAYYIYLHTALPIIMRLLKKDEELLSVAPNQQQLEYSSNNNISSFLVS